MNLKRMAAFTVVGAALARLLAAAVTSGSGAPSEPIVARVAPIDSRGEALASEIAKLHDHLRPAAAPRQPGRNLFSFTPRPSAPPPPLPPPLPRPALSEAAVRPPAPIMKLSGIAEDKVGDAVVRTAIISAFNQLFVVKEGDQVTDRYRVSRISPEVAELTDVTGGATIRLALK